MNQHHGELIVQFELLIDVQNDLNKSFHLVESSWHTNKQLPCLTEIDQWEQNITDRIQRIAAKARITATEMMVKNISDVRHRLDHLAFNMRERQQEGNFLDHDVIGVRNQLEQLNYSIKHINEKIRINHKATTKINWNSLMYATTNKTLVENRFNLPEIHFERRSSPDKIWNNLRKLIKHKHTILDYSNKQASLKRHSLSLFEPIALTSFGSSTCSLSPKKILRKSQPTISDNSSIDPFLNEDPFDYITFTSIEHDRLLPQSSDA